MKTSLHVLRSSLLGIIFSGFFCFFIFFSLYCYSIIFDKKFLFYNWTSILYGFVLYIYALGGFLFIPLLIWVIARNKISKYFYFGFSMFLFFLPIFYSLAIKNIPFRISEKIFNNYTKYAPQFNREIFDSIKIGDNRDFVKSRLGDPLSKYHYQKITIWKYSSFEKDKPKVEADYLFFGLAFDKSKKVFYKFYKIKNEDVSYYSPVLMQKKDESNHNVLNLSPSYSQYN